MFFDTHIIFLCEIPEEQKVSTFLGSSPVHSPVLLHCGIYQWSSPWRPCCSISPMYGERKPCPWMWVKLMLSKGQFGQDPIIRVLKLEKGTQQVLNSNPVHSFLFCTLHSWICFSVVPVSKLLFFEKFLIDIWPATSENKSVKSRKY